MKRIVVGIILLSFIIKLVWILKVPLTPIYDFETLYNVAVNLYNGKGFTLNGYPWGFQSYGYPLILSIFFFIVRNASIFTAKVFNLLCSTATLPFVYLILRKYLFRKKNILICLAIMAFLPNNIIYTNVLGSEILFTFIFAGLVCSLLYFKSPRSNLVNGILCGILSLIKPFFMAFPIVIIFISLIKNKKILWKADVLLIVGFFAILIPSVIKNYVAFGKLIPISYNGGYVLYINNNSQNDRGGWMDVAKVEVTDNVKEELANVGYIYDVPHEVEKQQMLRNADVSSVLLKHAIAWIIRNPIEFLMLGTIRIINVFFSGASDVSLWGFDNLSNSGVTKTRVYRIFMGASNTLIYLLSISYLYILIMDIKKIFSRKYSWSMLLLVWTMLFFYAVYFVFEGQARYNFPTLFLMIISLGLIIEKVGNTNES